METPRLHPDTVQQVRERLDIVEVVSEHVALRKRGKAYIGLCPFHEEKSGSFNVSPDKQMYHCFGCGAGGTAFTFLMETGHRSFNEVVLDLAKRYQIPVKTLEPSQRQEFQRRLSLREQLFEILAVTTRFYEHALYQPQGEAALTYLQNSRRLSRETIQRFQIGYAPAGWQTLYGYLVEHKRYPPELVEQAGLIMQREGGKGYYDRFRNRLMIPICNTKGQVIGFGGRSLGDEQPKYLNSPETELFDKGDTLFALDKARTSIIKQDLAIVVEGYFDAIALHAAGITHVVASMGTALGEAQLRRLLRYVKSKQLVLNFDADAAGIKAAERAIGVSATMSYSSEVQLKVLNLPDGKDPDEFLKNHSADEYRSLLSTAQPWLDWQIDKIIGGADLRQSEQFYRCTEAISELLGRIPSAPLRTHYTRYSAEALSQGDGRLALQLEIDLKSQVKGQRWIGQSEKWQRPASRSLLIEAEAQLLRVYLHQPRCRDQVIHEMNSRDVDFGLNQHRVLWQNLLEWKRCGVEDVVTETRYLFEEEEDLRELQHVLYLDEKGECEIMRGPLVIQAAVSCLERSVCEKRRRHMLELWRETDAVQKPDVARALQQQIYLETRRVAQIDREQRCASLIQLAQYSSEDEVVSRY